MHAKLLSDKQGERTMALIFDSSDEPIATLTKFAQGNHIHCAHFTAIGAFSHVTLGWFDPIRHNYRKNVINEQVEVLVLTGDITTKDHAPTVHAHVVVGKSDGSAWGGHLLRAEVYPTLELMLTDTPAHLERVYDEHAGLALIRIPEMETVEPPY